MAVERCSLPTEREEQIANIINAKRRSVGKEGKFNKKIIMSIIDTMTKGYSDEEFKNFVNRPLLDLVNVVNMYINNTEEKRAKEILKAINNPIVSYSRLREVYDASHRADRINMISDLFSAILDDLQSKYPSISREELCNGVTINGVKIGGEDRIFYEVERIIEERANKAKTIYQNPSKVKTKQGNPIGEREINHYKYISQEYFKVLDNWGALLSLTRMALKETEGLKIGQKSKYTAEATVENFSEEELDTYVIEEAIKEGWMTITDQVSAYGTLGAQVRRVLGKLYQRDENGNIIKDDLGRARRVNPVQAHREVLDVCRGMMSSSDMLSLLSAGHEAYKTINPDTRKEFSLFKDVIDLLSSDPNLMTPFYVDMKKNFVPYSKLSFKNWRFNIFNLNGIIRDNYREKYELSVRLGTIDASPYRHYNPESGKIIKNQRRIFKKVNGEVKVDLEGVRDLHNYITNYFGKVNSRTNEIELSDTGDLTKISFMSNASKRAALLYSVYNALGINITFDEAKSLAGALRGKNKQLTQLNEIIIHLANNFLSNVKTEELYIYKLRTTIGNSELDVSLSNALGKLEEILNKYARSKKLEATARYRNSRGKSITLQSNVTPNFIGDFFGKIQRLSELGSYNTLKNWIADTYLTSSMFGTREHSYNAWINELMQDKNGEFSSEFNIERHVGTEDTPFENYNKAQHITALIQYFNRDRMFNKNSNYSYYPVFIEGDAGQCKFIKAKRYNTDEAVKRLLDIYRSEIERMKVAYRTGKSMEAEGYNKVKVFDANKDKFRLLPFLNDKFKVEFKEVVIDGIPDVSCEVSIIGSNDSISIQDIENAIREAILSERKVFKKALSDNGLLKKTTNNNYRYLSSNNTVVNDENLDAFLDEYLVNSKLSLCCQLQLMTTCPSFYKDSETLQKRYKEIHAPGAELDLDAIDPYAGKDESGRSIRYSETGEETVIYFTDVIANPREDNPGLFNVIEEQFKDNQSIVDTYADETSVTDGQGYRTLTGYRKVMGMAGKWTNEMQEAYEIIQKIRDNIRGRENKIATMEEIKQVNELAVVFQPIKPYWYGFEKYQYDNEHFVNIPVQHKYAEAIVIPELLPNGTLKEMASYAEDNGIDLICSTECVKVGAWGDSKIDTKDVVGSMAKAKVHRLSYGGYKIQTNLPEHFNVNNQLFGTQVRKLIMDKMNKAADYSRYFEGIEGYKGTININGIDVKPTGLNVINLFNNLICSNILESEAKFNELINDPKKLSDMLVQLIASNSRNSKETLLSFEIVNDVFSTALSEAGVSHDVISSILSEFRKNVNKQRIKGGSAVQVSSFGITHIEGGKEKSLDYKVVNGNVVYAECEIPFNLSYKDATGREIALKYEDYCDEEGNILTDEEGNTLIEKDFPGILDILAYRIPTEKHYSMVNLRVKRFCKPIEGGIMRLPAEITSISGADFDADKLYFMLKSFVRTFDSDKVELSKKTKDDIWDKVWEMYPNIKEALRYAKQSAGYDLNTPYPPLNSFWESSTIAFSYDKDEVFAEAAEELEIDLGLDNQPKWVTYDLNKPAYEQSAVARNNMLIEIMRQRLMDPETLKDRLTPGGFANPRTSARKMRHLVLGSDIAKECINGDTVDFDKLERLENGKNDPKKSYDPTDINTLIYYNEQNQIAAKLIGAMANHNSNNAYSSVCEDLRLKEEIKFGSHLEGTVTSEVFYKDRGVYGTEVGATSLLSKTVTVQGDGKTIVVDPSLSVAELLASSVDAVKEPVLNYLNLNTATANIGVLLARLGYSFEDIGLLLNQPCVKEMCELCFNSNTNSLSYAITKIKNKYKTARGGVKVGAIDVLSRDKLAYYILSKKLNDDARIENPEEVDVTTRENFAAGQYMVMELIEKINAAASELDSFVKATKFTASNSVGSTAGELYAQQIKVEDYLLNAEADNSMLSITVDSLIPLPIRDNIGDIDLDSREARIRYLKEISRSPFAFEQAMYDANKRLLQSIKKYFPYETLLYKIVRKTFKDLSFYNMDGGTIDSIHNDLMIYLMTRQKGDFDGRRRSYLLNEFPTKLFKEFLNDSRLSNNLLLQSLGLTENTTLGKVVIDTNNIHKLQSGEKDVLKESWEDLYKYNPELSKDLFLYCFYRTGFEYNATTFIHLCPMSVKKSIMVSPDKSYYDFLKEINAGKVNLDGEGINDFVKQYLVNHRDNYRFNYIVRETSDSAFDKFIKQESTENGLYKDRFTITIDSNDELKDDFKKIARVTKDNATFKPIIIFGDPNSTTCVTYVAVLDERGSTTSDTFSMTYVKTDLRGLNMNGAQMSLDYGNLYEETQDLKPEDVKGHEEQMEYVFPEGGTEVMDDVYEAIQRNNIPVEEAVDYYRSSFEGDYLEGFNNLIATEGMKQALKIFKDSASRVKVQVDKILEKRKGEHCSTNTGESSCQTI